MWEGIEVSTLMPRTLKTGVINLKFIVITCPAGAIFVSPKIFMHQSKFIFHTTMIVFSVTNFLYEHKFAKIRAEYERIFCKNMSVIWVKIRALVVKYSIFQKWQELLF